MTSKQGQYMLDNLSNVFSRDPNGTLAKIMYAMGGELDKIDPVQIGLAQERAISTASGDYLDGIAKDWGVTRRYQESDASFRARILTLAPVFMNGPTTTAIGAVVAAFVGGVQPIIIEYGPDSFIMGISKMGQFVFMSSPDPFTFQVQVQNPQSVAYSRADMEEAVNTVKPARSSATFVHQGGV